MGLEEKKSSLIDELISQNILKTPAIIEAFRKVPRERFVLQEHTKHAYVNYPLPIYEGQTISQPLTVAVLTEAAQPKKGNKILEIGAGSGYQAALLSTIVGSHGRIIAIERLHKLAEFAKENLKKYKNVTVIEADGSCGYEKSAPYDCIIVSASAPSVPDVLLKQLKVNGKIVITVVDRLLCITKKKSGKDEKFLGYFSFVPLIGKNGYKE